MSSVNTLSTAESTSKALFVDVNTYKIMQAKLSGYGEKQPKSQFTNEGVCTSAMHLISSLVTHFPSIMFACAMRFG